jgi:hypothetical protein
VQLQERRRQTNVCFYIEKRKNLYEGFERLCVSITRTMLLHPHDGKLTKTTNDFKTRAGFRYLRRSNRPVIGRWLAGAKAGFNTDGQKMIATRVTESGGSRPIAGCDKCWEEMRGKRSSGIGTPISGSMEKTASMIRCWTSHTWASYHS